MSESLIGVLDCNNFFVSCERLFRPDLVGKPVVVLSSNDGCVIARSQEIKDMGISMGVPYFTIKDTMEKAGATTFSSHFALYRDISRRVFEVMREELEVVEQYSIDEAFFTVAGDFEGVARRVKQAVETKVGIPVSIGIAKTKTLAKLASKKAKKSGGVYLLNDEVWTELMTATSLAEIWGVGGALELKYKQHNLRTVAEFINTDTSRITALFGSYGTALQQELKGVSVFKLGHKIEPKQSLVSSRSFQKTTDKFEVLADAVAYHMRHAAADLRMMQLKTGVVRVFIQPSRHGDFILRGGSKEFILDKPTNDSIELLNIANELLKAVYEAGVPYKKAGVTLNQFVPESINQTTLFEPLETINSKNELMKTVDYLNGKKGKELVLLGSRLLSEKWQSRSAKNSPAYTTRWSDIAKVQAK